MSIWRWSQSLAKLVHCYNVQGLTWVFAWPWRWRHALPFQLDTQQIPTSQLFFLRRCQQTHWFVNVCGGSWLKCPSVRLQHLQLPGSNRIGPSWSCSLRSLWSEAQMGSGQKSGHVRSGWIWLDVAWSKQGKSPRLSSEVVSRLASGWDWQCHRLELGFLTFLDSLTVDMPFLLQVMLLCILGNMIPIPLLLAALRSTWCK